MIVDDKKPPFDADLDDAKRKKWCVNYAKNKIYPFQLSDMYDDDAFSYAVLRYKQTVPDWRSTLEEMGVKLAEVWEVWSSLEVYPRFSLLPKAEWA